MFDISIQPGLSVDRQAALEEEGDQALNVSTLVVGSAVSVYTRPWSSPIQTGWL
jgi:hypothetical protein